MQIDSACSTLVSQAAGNPSATFRADPRHASRTSSRSCTVTGSHVKGVGAVGNRGDLDRAVRVVDQIQHPVRAPAGAVRRGKRRL